MVDEIALEYDQDVLLRRFVLGITMELEAQRKWWKMGFSVEEVDKAVLGTFVRIVGELKAETIRIV